jgi:uncharacterized RDD family membrane protein YckC
MATISPPMSAVPPPVKTQQYEPGGIGRRLVALIIDGCVSAVLKLPIDIALMVAFGIKVALIHDPKQPLDPIYNIASGAFGIAFLFVYHGWFNLNKGGTPGKLIMKLRVMRADDGTRIGYGRSFAREISKIVFLVMFFIDALVPIFRKDKRAVHDLVCNTKVLHIKD